MDSSNAGLFVEIVLVLITFGLLAVAYKNQWLKKKASKKPQILDEVQLLIIPFKTVLDNNYRNLRMRYYGWSCYADGLRIMGGIQSLPLESNNKFTFNDFSKKHKKLGQSIISYNKDIATLKKRLRVIDRTLSTSKMREVYVDKAGSFNQEYYGQYKLDNGIHRKIIPLIIQNIRVLEYGETESFQKFWDENADFFLKFRDEGPLKKDFDELDLFSKRLFVTSNLLNDELETILDSYRVDFDLPEEKVTPPEGI